MKNTSPVSAEPELSRPLPVEKISAGGIAEHIVARPDERKALAQRFGILDLQKLEAKLDIDLTRAGKMIAVKGVLDADVVQECVVTLEPLSTHITEKVEVLFTPDKLMEPEDDRATLHQDMAEEEPPEPIIDGVIDLGEVVAQHLALALDPYPRAPGAALPSAEPPETVVKVANPFVQLKKKLEKGEK